MSQFLRGEPVIISDSDRPEAPMIASIIGWYATEGYWKARYLSPTTTHLIYCWSPNPTPVSAFGMTVEIDVHNIEFRAVPHGERTATYRDGRPRNWQEYGAAVGRWHKARGPAFLLLQSWLAREIKKVTA